LKINVTIGKDNDEERATWRNFPSEARRSENLLKEIKA